ncbi:MAG: hypothetical protein WKF77_14625 [Planctomycetaceae bacterium]
MAYQPDNFVSNAHATSEQDVNKFQLKARRSAIWRRDYVNAALA